jgi:hypothetical protein
VGFSAVLFALKVVLNHRAADYSSIMGLTLPTKVGPRLRVYMYIKRDDGP